MNAVALPLAERLAGEPSRWHARFVAYSRLPPAMRTLERVWREECSSDTRRASAKGGRRRPSGAWQRMSARFQWKERASTLDGEALRREAEVLATERQAECERRRQLSTTLMTRVTGLLNDIAIVGANPANVARAAAIALEQSRLEFGVEQTASARTEAAAEAVESPVLKIIFETTKDAGAPAVRECDAGAGFNFRRS